jgi:hypothetical protein
LRTYENAQYIIHRTKNQKHNKNEKRQSTDASTVLSDE